MRNWMKNAGLVALVGAGFFAVGSGVAGADVSGNNDSLLSGNQVEAPISVPINVSGNALGLLGGSATARGAGGSQVVRTGESAGLSSNSRSVLSGNQVKAPISVPLNVCGNAASLSGLANAACGGRPASAMALPAPALPVAAPQAPATNACKFVLPAPAAPTTVCAPPAAPSVPARACTLKCEDVVRTLPANALAVTSMTIPVSSKHSAGQQVFTYEKLTNVRQSADSVVNGARILVTTPGAAVQN